MYADTITKSMQKTIDETNRRREKQQEYNRINNIVPTQIQKTERNILGREQNITEYNSAKEEINIIQDPILEKLDYKQLQKSIDYARAQMEAAAAELDFVRATKFRDQMRSLQELLTNKGKYANK
jgi:excinuclease ABC subunit B